MPLQMLFGFPSSIFAVLAVRYLDVDERGDFFPRVDSADAKAQAEEQARILREINPQITSVLVPTSLAEQDVFDPVVGHEDTLGGVSVYVPDEYYRDVVVEGGVIVSTNSGFQSLRGKHVTFHGSKENVPVLLVWSGEVSEDPEDLEFLRFADNAASVLVGIDRVFFGFSEVA